MTSRSGLSAALGAALAVALAPAGLAGQELSVVSGETSPLPETVLVDAVPAPGFGSGLHDSGGRFCGAPFDVRFGSAWGPYFGSGYGFHRPFGYPYGWYGRWGGWDPTVASFFSPFNQIPCSHVIFGRTGRPFLFFTGGYGSFGYFGGSRWSFWNSDPWSWGYGYNPRLAHGYGYAPKSGWWAPYGYGSAPYGSDREVFEDLMRRRGPAPPPSPTQTAGANPADAGEDGPDVTRFGPTGIRAGGADLRKVRPDMPPVVVLGGDPAAESKGRVDGSAIARTSARPLTRETLGEALARSRAELAARRVELMRGSASGDLARRGLSPVRGPEVFARPVEPPRTVGFDRSRFGSPRYEGAFPRGASSFDRRGARESMGSPTTPRSFSSPPRAAPAPGSARSGGSGERSGGGKKAAPE